MTLISPSLGLSLWTITGLILMALPLMALIHLFRSNVRGADRLTWVLLVLFMPVLGSILYFVIGRNAYRRDRSIKIKFGEIDI